MLWNIITFVNPSFIWFGLGKKNKKYWVGFRQKSPQLRLREKKRFGEIWQKSYLVGVMEKTLHG